MINQTLDELIAKCKALVEAEDAAWEEEFLSEADPSILHFLVAGGDDINSKQLRDDLMTLLIAGHETTAAVLTWTMHLLSSHPEVVERIRAEVGGEGGEGEGEGGASERRGEGEGEGEREGAHQSGGGRGRGGRQRGGGDGGRGRGGRQRGGGDGRGGEGRGEGGRGEGGASEQMSGGGRESGAGAQV